jgi:hypothetical protein
MDVENLAKELILKNMTPEQQTAVLDSIKESVAKAKEVQKRKIGENVDLVVQALKKIESDIRSRYDDIGNSIEKRVASIKDGRDGIDGKDGRDGKDGKQGKDGRPGRDGKDGKNGLDGADGQDGISVVNAHIDFDGSLVIHLSSGKEINVGEVVAPDLAEKIKVITNGGGTSQTVLDTLASLQAQIDALIPSQTGNSGKFLTTNGSTLSWASVTGGLSYQGTWNATTNTPTLASGVGTNGYYYVVATAGSTNLDGITDWQIGDWLMFNGTVWQKIDQSNLVTSVNGQTGAVSLTTTNINEGTNLYYLDSRARQSLSAGTGISYSTSTGVITNSSPDQVVSLTGAGTTSISGTYPSFTITSNDQYQGTVTSVTGTSPIVSSGGTTPAISIPQATSSVSGYLSSTDWTTFNNKGSGTVTSVGQSFTGGLISVSGSPITSSGTLALTVAGTSGGIPYFSSGTTWASSSALAANSLVIGGGAGAAPSTITTGTNVLTALGVNVGTAGAFVVNGGALGTPSSGTVTNLTGTASININGTVGATTPNTGAFTTLSATGNVDLNGGTFVFNDSGADKDARFEGDTDANLLFTDASTDRVGIGTSTPTQKLDVNGYISVNSNNISADNSLGFRNRIINGDMRIDQRNAGAAVTTGSSFPVDRFTMLFSTDGAFSAQQDSSAPTGFIKSTKITTTTADGTLAATQFFGIRQNIEGTNVADLAWGTANAKTVTLSFWVRSSLTGTFGGALGNSANNRSYPFTYTISSANTWEQKTVTIAGDTSGTWLTDTGVGIRVDFGLGTGSTYSGTAGAWAGAQYVSATGATSVIGTLNATWYATGVQLEVGSVATPFERRPYGTELALCQRYYEKSGTMYCQLVSDAASNGLIWVEFAVTKRATPTMSAPSNWGYTRSGSSGTFTTNFTGTGVQGTACYGSIGAAWSVAHSENNSGWIASAEL